MSKPYGRCWEWHGSKVNNGYGRVDRYGKHWLAHRLAYTELVGPIPAGLELDHLCRNRACYNPAHLEPVTSAENARRTHERRGTTSQHGTLAYYVNYKCRCPACYKACSEYNRKKRECQT